MNGQRKLDPVQDNTPLQGNALFANIYIEHLLYASRVERQSNRLRRSPVVVCYLIELAV